MQTIQKPTAVTITRSESQHLSMPLLVGGLYVILSFVFNFFFKQKQISVAAVFGFSIYYLFPLSLLSLNVELLVNLFVAILCGMLLSMVKQTKNVLLTISCKQLGVVVIEHCDTIAIVSRVRIVSFLGSRYR